MDQSTEDAALPVYGRITWGAYDRLFSVSQGTSHVFRCKDKHGSSVEIAAFDPQKFQTDHPVALTCTAAARFSVTDELNEAFKRLAAGELPSGSRNEAEVKSDSFRDGIYHSYSLPYDQYPIQVQTFISEIYAGLLGSASRVWRLLRWRTAATGSHEVFQTILASEWSRDSAAWQDLPVKAYVTVGSYAIPRIGTDIEQSVQDLLTDDVAEPSSEELLREAWAASRANPRAGLLLAVAAAEVGFKELVTDLVPEVRWLTLNVPAPPLVRLLSNSLPELPVRAGIAEPPPKEIRRVLENAVKARNDLAHQGEFDRLGIDLDEVLAVVPIGT